MRLSINFLCVAGEIGPQHRPYFELAKQVGYDGVEIPVLAGSHVDYETIGQLCDHLGLARTATAIIPDPDASPLSADPASRKRGIEHLNWALDCCAAMGAECMGGPFHAPIGHFTGSGATQAELELGASAHFALAERAQKNGMTLALEPLNRFETYFLNTMAQARAYADRVAHPAFGIMYDTFHANIEEQNQCDAIALLGDAMRVLHVSENDRGIPGRGQIDFLKVFHAAQKSGFGKNGREWIVIEAFGSGLPQLAAATRVWRPLFPDHETLFREAHDFVRAQWASPT